VGLFSCHGNVIGGVEWMIARYEGGYVIVLGAGLGFVERNRVHVFKSRI
jgi:hypothetical protein